MSDTDDARAAAQIRASLSTQVIAACLAGIAAEAVIATFVFQFRHLAWDFGTVAVFAAAFFGVSIFFGMRFVATISTHGYRRTWPKDAGVGWYYAQATSGGLGFILVVVLAILAGHAPERNRTVVVPTSFMWFNRTWGRDDRAAFEHQAFTQGHTRTSLAKLYRTHLTVRRVLGVAG